jgi:hypothetical protein
MSAVAKGRERAWVGSFHVWVAAGFVLVTFGGFMPTYFGPMASGSLHKNPVVHIHGLVFFTWTLLFLVQAVLAATGQTRRHRDLGLLGVSLATAMSILGPLAVLNTLETAYATGTGELAETFSIIPLSGICVFAIVAALAFANVHRPEVHRRLLVLSIVAVVDAPLARLTIPSFAYLYSVAHGGALPLWVGQQLSFALADSFVLAALVYDWRTRGRPHPVNIAGGTVIVIMHCLRQPISETAAWHSFVHHFRDLAGSFPPLHG